MKTRLALLSLLLLPALADIAAAAPDPVQAAIAGLSAKSKPERVRAIRTLQWQGPAAAPAVPALLKALEDPDASVRLAAIRALGHVGPKAKSAIKALEALQKDPDPTLKNDAKIALDRIQAAAKPRLPAGSPYARDLANLKRKTDAQLARDLDADRIAREARGHASTVDMILMTSHRDHRLALTRSIMASRTSHMASRLGAQLIKGWATYQGLTDPKRKRRQASLLKDMHKSCTQMRADAETAAAEYRNLRIQADRLGILADLLAEGTALLRKAGQRSAREARELYYWILGVSGRYRYRHGVPLAELENVEAVLLKFSKRKGLPTVPQAWAARVKKAQASAPSLTPPTPKLQAALAGAAGLK